MASSSASSRWLPGPTPASTPACGGCQPCQPCKPCKTQCSPDNKKNKCDLDTNKVPITYGCASTPVHLRLPRLYTSTHDDASQQIFVHVGSEYSQALLDTDEIKQFQTQVLGSWSKRISSSGSSTKKTSSKSGRCEYSIRFVVLVSTPQNPYPQLRNAIFCAELNKVLQAVALAESGLLCRRPELAKAKIYIHFSSSVCPEVYDRTECWGTLGEWSCSDKKCGGCPPPPKPPCPPPPKPPCPPPPKPPCHS